MSEVYNPGVRQDENMLDSENDNQDDYYQEDDEEFGANQQQFAPMINQTAQFFNDKQNRK